MQQPGYPASVPPGYPAPIPGYPAPMSSPVGLNPAMDPNYLAYLQSQQPGAKKLRATKEVSRKYANSLAVDGFVVGFVIWLFIFKTIEVILPDIRTLFVEFNLVLTFILFLDVLYRLYAYYFIRFLKRRGDVACFVVSTLAFIGQIIVFMYHVHPFHYYDSDYSDSLPYCTQDDDDNCTEYDPYYVDPQAAFADLGANIASIFVFASIIRCWRLFRLHKWFKNRNDEIRSTDSARSDTKLFDAPESIPNPAMSAVGSSYMPTAVPAAAHYQNSTPAYPNSSNAYSAPAPGYQNSGYMSSSAPASGYKGPAPGFISPTNSAHPTHVYPYNPSNSNQAGQYAPPTGQRPSGPNQMAPNSSKADNVKGINSKYRESPYLGKTKTYK
eukprot:TRINITY_DN1966_c0_g1_i1.p1 TRINITY_DN1966_c0_g1~~TRINITY_DN1966_c0_g1_i1.p1  ORF type:complete len:383 (+),score=107.63 TRINITY_DN1966_c0_g1_i1:36-1184(+)